MKLAVAGTGYVSLSGAARIQETVRETAAQLLKLLPENSL